MSASNEFTKQFTSVPRPHSKQIAGIVRIKSWGWDIRDATFEHYLLCVVTLPEPAGIALCRVGRSHRLCYLFFAFHPPAHFLRSILVNDYELVFMGVRHMTSFSARALSSFPGGATEWSTPAGRIPSVNLIIALERQIRWTGREACPTG